MTTVQDAIDNIITYLQSNMSTVADGTISSSSIVDEFGTEALDLPKVISSLVADPYTDYVGGYTSQAPLIQFLISADTKAKRNSIREDICTTLLAGRTSITNVQTLRIVGKRNLGPEQIELNDVETYVAYTAIVEMEFFYS